MTVFLGTGARGGPFSGTVVWVDPIAPPAGPHPGVRAGLALVRAVVRQGQADVEVWRDSRPDLAGRLMLQQVLESLADDGWTTRALRLLEMRGLSPAAALREAGAAVAVVMEQRGLPHDRAAAARAASAWLAWRLEREALPADAVLAGFHLPPLILLDAPGPALTGAYEPPADGSQPLVWGVDGLSPAWHGRRVSVDGNRISLHDGEDIATHAI